MYIVAIGAFRSAAVFASTLKVGFHYYNENL